MMESLLEWMWDRHHNILSWYIRPLFILPYCYFAYQRKLRYVLLTLAILPTTLFWFPAPEQPSAKVIEYLAWERDFLLTGALWTRASFVCLVVLFLWLLALAFWKRNIWYGALIVNIGTGVKVVWSMYFGGDVGSASLLPAAVTLVICNALFLLIYYIYHRGTQE